MKHLSQEDLVLIYYREPGVPESAYEHLRHCQECRTSAESLSGVLDICSEWTVPEPPPQLARSVWAHIAPQTEAKSRRGPRFLLWLVPALLALLVASFEAGRLSKKPEPLVTAGLSDQARQRILAISLADHLDRAEILLTEISNAGDSGPADFSSTRYSAQDLVDEGRLLRQTLAAKGQNANLSLLDEVERFMLEVANAPDRVSPSEIQALQGRIGSGSLLFKVRIIESNMRSRGQTS